jgi:putative membrane protein
MAIQGPVRYGTGDWISCIKSLPTSRILRRTRLNILFFTVWAFILTALHKVAGFTWLQLPPSLTSVLGPTLSLLLVFRTNSSYDRFWEARKSQSSMVYACRNLAMHAYVHLPKSTWRELATLLCTYALVQKQHLQGVITDEELAPLFSSAEMVKDIQSRKNRPLHVIKLLEVLIHKSLSDKYKNVEAADFDPTMPKYIEKHMIEGLATLSAHLVTCERIIKQPVPLSYTRHTSRFLSLFITLLPFSLLSNGLGWLVVPITTLITWSLVSIQEISHYVEEPFDASKQIIQLNSICSVVRSDVSEILDGVLEGAEMDRLEDNLLQETLRNSRAGDESRAGFYKKK